MTATPGNATLTTSPEPVNNLPDRPLRIRVRQPDAHTVVVEASGTLALDHDGDVATVLANQLNSAPEFLVLDLTGGTFPDTATAMTMLEASTRARSNGTRLQVMSNSAVDRMLALIGMSEHVTDTAVADDQAAASGDGSPREALLPTQRRR